MVTDVSSKGRILVVDDDPGVRRVLTSILKYSGYTAHEAESAEEGLSLLDSDIYLIITDMRMPGKNGIDMTREVRSRYPSLPVVMITGFGASREKEAREAGVNDFLLKPVTHDALIDIADRYARR